jgi:hypothetical protein
MGNPPVEWDVVAKRILHILPNLRQLVFSHDAFLDAESATMTGLSAGDYSHKFQGNAIDVNSTPYFIGGVGTMTLTAATSGFTISGVQQAVALPMGNQVTDVTYVTYLLTGTVVQQTGKPIWDADITFTQNVASDPIVMKGQFALVPAGSWDKFWAVSTGSEIIHGADVAPTEAVMGTIRRLPS